MFTQVSSKTGTALRITGPFSAFQTRRDLTKCFYSSNVQKEPLFVGPDLPVFCSCVLATPLHLGECLPTFYLTTLNNFGCFPDHKWEGIQSCPHLCPSFPCLHGPLSIYVYMGFFSSFSPLNSLSCEAILCSCFPSASLFLLWICYPHGLSWERGSFFPIAFFLIQIYM